MNCDLLFVLNIVIDKHCSHDWHCLALLVCEHNITHCEIYNIVTGDRENVYIYLSTLQLAIRPFLPNTLMFTGKTKLMPLFNVYAFCYLRHCCTILLCDTISDEMISGCANARYVNNDLLVFKGWVANYLLIKTTGVSVVYIFSVHFQI